MTKPTELRKEFNVDTLPYEISAAMKEHLGVESNMMEYIPLPHHRDKALINNSFIVHVDIKTEFLDQNIEYIIELLCDRALKARFEKCH